MTGGARLGQAGGQQWQAGQDPRARQRRPGRRNPGTEAAPGRYEGGTANGSAGYAGPGGPGGPGSYGARAGHGAPAGYGIPAGYSEQVGYGDPAGYGDPGARSAAGLRERAIDRTGIRQRLADLSGGPGDGDGSGPGGRGGGSRPRVKGSWWRHWTWRKALAVLGAACALLIVAVVVAFVAAYEQTPVPTEVSATALQQSSVVYFSNGKTQVGTFNTGTNRQMLTSGQIPTVLKQAVIAAEDRHYYSEGGISPTGILRAAYQDLTGGQFQGGSTITQQFVRNYYSAIGTSQTLSRKIKEIFVAIKLSHEKSKDWILTQYLNTIYLGSNAYGAGAAAQTYFGKPASKLDLAQSAMIAAMINEPGVFDPTPHTQGYAPLVARWHYVLTNMVRDGAITQQQATAQKFPKIVKGHRNNGWTGYRGYIMQAVELELKNRYHYSQQQIFGSGLKIVTTFSQPMMRALYQSVRQNERAMRQGGMALPRFANIGAVLEKPGTGAIVAMYGGPNYAKRQLNMALQSRNQVGSSFKPYVLATAVAQGMNVKTSVLDGYAAICAPDDNFRTVFSVRVASSTSPCPTTPADGWFNFSSPEANGPVSVVQASAMSLNTAYGDLIHRVGTQNVINMAQQFGVNTANYPSGSGLQRMKGQSGIALGQASLTVEEQANTFAALADGGQSVTPHVVSKITTQSGAVIPLKIIRNSALTPGQAADVDYALSFDTKPGGTGYPNAPMPDGRPIIGKTGTTNNAQSAFFIGAIPQYALAVGIFTNKQSQTLNGLGGQSAGGFGGTWPALIWHTFALKEFAQLPIRQFPVPPFAGSKWVQVRPVAHHRHRHPGPPRPTPPCKFHGKKKGCPAPAPAPTPTPTPTPTQTSPSPSPSPSCSTGPPGRCQTTPPGG